MPELLLEILSEEIPARMQARAAEDLKRLVTDGLKDAGLAFDSAEAYVTPRRLTLVVDGLPIETPDISEERRGPKTNAPEKAINGFLGSVGLTLDQLEKRETGKGEFYFAQIEKKGVKTNNVMKDILGSTLNRFPWPKSMKWADCDLPWVRKIHTLLAVFDGEIIPFSIALKSRDGKRAWGESRENLYESENPLTASNTTRAHPFLTDTEIRVTDFADYKKQLEVGHVILDAAERRQIIKDGAEKLAADAGLTLRDDPALLDEVAGLVEWPVPLMGSIDAEFMDIPPEVLTTTMRKNQKYFALEDKNGKLAPKFITVANKETPDGGAAIIAGNERVLRARLADAKFFWDQDRKATLESRKPLLQDITFHAKLGTVLDKVERIKQLALLFPGPGFSDILGVDPDNKIELEHDIVGAADRCKSDLVTGMVTEFPEVQGIMGRHYALEDGENNAVANAIAEHYSPVGPSDNCPTAPASVAIALADKIDTLVGFWAIDEKPTGSKDPFALRRAALGVIRLILDNKLRIGLSGRIKTAYVHYLQVFMKRSMVLRDSSSGTSDYYDRLYNPIDAGQFIDHNVLVCPVPNHYRRNRDEDMVVENNVGEEFEEEKLEPIVDNYSELETELPPIATFHDDLLSFFAERLKVHLREKGVRHDLISAVFSLGGEDDLVRLLARVDALGEFLETKDGVNLLTAYKRAANILRIEEKNDNEIYKYDGIPLDLLVEDAEKVLFDRLMEVGPQISAGIENEDYANSMKLLASLGRYIDVFFDNVKVNAENPNLRENRLRMLDFIRSSFHRIADFSKIEGGER